MTASVKTLLGALRREALPEDADHRSTAAGDTPIELLPAGRSKCKRRCPARAPVAALLQPSLIILGFDAV